MVKMIGLILIISSILALIVGAYIDSKFSSTAKITGNVVVNILTQSHVSMGFYDYTVGLMFSYSIASFIVGIMFLFRV